MKWVISAISRYDHVARLFQHFFKTTYMPVDQDTNLEIDLRAIIKLEGSDTKPDQFPIQPFTQTPSDEPETGPNGALCVHDQFWLFTSEIILQHKVFVR